MILHQTETVTVCGPPPGIHERGTSPHCKGQRAVYTWDGAYYGYTGYCECGDAWSDGYLHERPFRRGWRQEAQREFEKKWATAIPRFLFKRYTRAETGMALGHDDEAVASACDSLIATSKAIEEARLLGDPHIVPMLWRARSENA